MPRFEITGPDGAKYQVDGPEGSTEQDALAQVQQQVGTAKATEPPPPEPGIGHKLGLGVRNVAEGVIGPAYDVVGAGLRAVGLPVNKFAENLTALGLPEAQTPFERGAGAVIEGASGALPFVGAGRVMATAASPVMRGAGEALATQPALQAASGGVAGGVTQATDSPLLGMAAGLATPLAAAGAGRVVSPVAANLSPEREALVRAAQAENIPLSIGEQTGSRALKNTEAALAQLPGSAGGSARAAADEQRAFTKAAMQRGGVDSDVATPDVLNAALAREGGTIGTIANRNTLQVTPALEGQLVQIEDSLRFLPSEVAGPIKARIDQLRGMMIPPPAQPPGTVLPPGATPPQPTIPGASYRMMDSALGKSIKDAQGDQRTALVEMRKILRGAMDASISPQDAADWQQARRNYANLKVLADAVSGAGEKAAEGQIPPLALRAAVDRSTGGGYEYGRGDLNELARVGQSVMRPPADSGTAGRTFMNQLLTGGVPSSAGILGGFAGGFPGAVLGTVGSLAIPAAVGAGMRSRAGQAWLTNQLGIGLVDPRVMAGVTGNLATRNVFAREQD